MTASPPTDPSKAQGWVALAFPPQGPRWGVLGVLALVLASVAVTFATHVIDEPTASRASVAALALLVTELRRPPADAASALMLALGLGELGAHFVGGGP